MSADPSIIARYERLYSAIVSDSVEALGHGSRALGHRLQPFHTDQSRVVVGPAFPCLCEKTDERIEIDMLLEMVDATPDRSMVVVATDQEIVGALWGGLMSAGVQAKGAVGAVVNAGVRDLHQILPLGFAVYARFRSPLDIRGRAAMTSYGRPVEFEGVPVQPGELVFADNSGVVVVPKGAELDVLELCEERVGKEAATQDELTAGRKASDVYAKYEAF